MYASHRGDGTPPIRALVLEFCVSEAGARTRTGIPDEFPCEADATGWGRKHTLRMIILESEV